MSIVTSAGALSTATATGRVAVLFHATACPFCRTFAPEFRRIVSEHNDVREVEALMEFDDNPLWERFAIDVVPTVLFFEDGMLSSRLDGRISVGLTPTDLSEALDAFARNPA